MSERQGLYRILRVPIVYRFVQLLFRHKATSNTWFRLIGNHSKKLVLDVGCGPGKDSVYFTDAQRYVGMDISQVYVSHAQSTYSNFGDFYCISAENIESLPIDNIDLVLMKGVFHHMSDDSINDFLSKLKKKLNKSAKIISIDPTYCKGRPIANALANLDRGRFVRSQKNLDDLVSAHMRIEEQHTVIQLLPPYQRLLLKLSND